MLRYVDNVLIIQNNISMSFKELFVYFLMVLSFKNSYKINIINLLLNLSMTLSIVFGVFELKETFSYIKMVAIGYAILYEILIFIAIYAGLKEMNLPECIDIFENGYIQLLGFILINLLLMDTSLVGLIVGSIIIAISMGISIYALNNSIE